jgi:predicted nucleic acid-binding Zn ribbon protein
METIPEKTCLNCGKQLRGRADKRFCDDYCRNNYNNQLNSDDNKTVRNINNYLRKNRRILKALLPETEEMATVSRQKLLQEQFQFQYLTHIYTTQKQQTYFFVYEYGYLPIGEDKILIVRRK